MTALSVVGQWLLVLTSTWGRVEVSNTNVHISALNCYNRLLRKFTGHYCWHKLVCWYKSNQLTPNLYIYPVKSNSASRQEKGNLELNKWFCSWILWNNVDVVEVKKELSWQNQTSFIWQSLSDWSDNVWDDIVLTDDTPQFSRDNVSTGSELSTIVSSPPTSCPSYHHMGLVSQLHYSSSNFTFIPFLLPYMFDLYLNCRRNKVFNPLVAE